MDELHLWRNCHCRNGIWIKKDVAPLLFFWYANLQLTSLPYSKGLFTWKWGTPGR